MDHNHGSNGSCTQTPRCLPAELFLFIGIQEFNIKHFSEILAKLMGSSSLNSSSTDWYIYLCCSSKICTWESLINRFSSFDDWNSHQIFIAGSIDLKTIHDLFCCTFFSRMSSMSFLPEEFSCSNKWSWMFEFPSNDI